MFSIVGTSTSASRAPALGASLRRMGNALYRVWKAWRNRREFYRLGEMSDAELADIGLTRSDLSVAVGLPLGVDPTAHLGAIAQSRFRSIEDGARCVS
ncbi:MAG TPA: DUF1127 domain-containing protein [Mesorhizobium sp.]|jgi:uncharacterized protein YjiS (DUF1127 family)|nr:DUF1127 domain-containing protein [Mesorhizobium sp.]